VRRSHGLNLPHRGRWKAASEHLARWGCLSTGARLDEARGLEFVPNGDSQNCHGGTEPEPPRSTRVEFGDVDLDDSTVVTLEKEKLIRIGDPVHAAAEARPASVLRTRWMRLFKARRCHRRRLARWRT